MKKKHNEGFSLVEVLVAIVILGIFVVPTCSSLVLSFQMNQKTAQMLKAQQAVSSAVEELKAKGITSVADLNNLPDVEVVEQTKTGVYYTITIRSDTVESVVVQTVIRDASALKNAGTPEPTNPTEESTPAESTPDESTDESKSGGDSQ